MSSRYFGCQLTAVAGLNSVYGATFAASVDCIGGIPSALRLGFGATTSVALAAAATISADDSAKSLRRIFMAERVARDW